MISIYKATIAGASPTLLYSFTLGSGTTFEFVGSNDSILLYTLTTQSTPPGILPLQTQLVALNASSGVASVLATYPGQATAGLTPLPPEGAWASAGVFVNVVGLSNVSPLGPVTYSSAAFMPSGASLQALNANSQWQFASVLGGVTNTVCANAPCTYQIMLQFNGITDTSYPFIGGATVDEFNLTSFSSSAVGTFAIPSGCDFLLSAAYPNAIVSGEMFCLAEGTFTQTGVAANLSLNQIVDAISVPGSIVSTDALRRIATPGSATRPR